MGFDELKGQAEGLTQRAKDFAAENPEQVSQGIEGAGDFVDEKTGGQYAGQVDGVQDRARDFLTGDNNGENAGEENV